MNHTHINQQINALLPTLGDGKWQNDSFVSPFGEFVLLLTHPDTSMELEANLDQDPRPLNEIMLVFNGWLSRRAR